MEILFVDTETGGVTADVSLLQVGLVAYRDGEILDELDFGIKDETYTVTPYSLHFNQIDLWELYRTGVTKTDAVKLTNQFVHRNFVKPPVFGGHNIWIDKTMLKALYQNNNDNLDNHISHRTVDTMGILWALYDAGKIPQSACSSDGAFQYFGIELGARHKAIDDCRATAQLYRSLVELIKRKEGDGE